jgi:SAM-dependent methyltransferase
MKDEIDIAAGRAAFGEDPAGYLHARPDYPDALYARLAERTSLRIGTAVFEVGPGPGLATARLLKLGANPLVAVEPDSRLAGYLRTSFPQLSVVNQTFEDVELARGAFDLGVAATSFHWLEQDRALAKVRSALRSGGWWAMWWTEFGAGLGADPFQDATRHLFAEAPRAPGHGRRGGPTFAMDHEARLADLSHAGFTETDVEIWPWTIELETRQLIALYATFSPVQALPEAKRQALLEGLADVADSQFGGSVMRWYSSVLYTARKP